MTKALITLRLICGTAMLLSLLCVFTNIADAKIGKKVGSPLQEALDLSKKSDFDGAIAKAKEAEAIPGKTEEEEFQTNEVLGHIYQLKGDYAMAATYQEKNLASPMAQADLEKRVKNVMALYTRAGNQAKAAEYSKIYLEKFGGSDDVRASLAMTQYQGGEYATALESLKPLVGQPNPQEGWLALYSNVQGKLGDTAGQRATLKKLLLAYPNKKYWEIYLPLLQAQARDDKTILQIYRLQLATGTFESANDYIESATVALKLGFPGEAMMFLDDAKAQGEASGSGREQQIYSEARSAAATDKSTLAQQDRQAAGQSSGQSYALLGEAYMSYGLNTQAVDALSKALAKGGLKNKPDAQLSLGIAQYRAGQRDAAQQSFSQVGGGSLGELGELWQTFLKQS